MTRYGLNDCTNLSNIIDIMNSLTVPCFRASTAAIPRSMVAGQGIGQRW